MHPPRPTTSRVADVLAATIAVMAALPAFAAKFIEQSRVIYPKAIGALKLDRVSYDEKQPFAGVTFAYAIASRPGTTLYARIQPAGRLPEADAMQAGVARTHEDLRAEYATGNYNDVQMQPDRKIDLQASETVVLHGRLLSHSFTRGAVRFEARTLLFYRYDYWLILRLAAGGLAPSEADQASVGAAADLVPELRIANRGDCSLNPASIQEQVAQYEANKPYARERRGNSAVVKGRLSAEDALAVASFQRIADQQVGCVPNFKYDFAKPIKGQAFVTLRFPKGAWD